MATVKGSSIRALGVCALLLVACGTGFRAEAQAAAGYSEYIIPGNEGQVTVTGATSQQLGLYYVLNQLDDNGAGVPAGSNMHSVITVTAWAPNTTLYYDHWEDGLDFDPNNPSTADETVVLTTTGQVQTFESANFLIPVEPRVAPANCDGSPGCIYDGGDRMFVAGGAVTVTRAGWVEERQVGNQAVAWEIYPVKPQLTTYVLPFGENLFPANPAFERVFALVQATADDTKFKVDVDGDGTWDVLNVDRSNALDGSDATEVTLDAGKTFLLDAISACSSRTACQTVTSNPLETGAVIQGSATLQVKFVAGLTTANYGTRGLSAFPRGYWTKEYYAPLDQRSGTNGTGTDYFLHNPHGTDLTVNWESRTSNGTFQIPANETVSFNDRVATDVPVDSGLYLSASDVFWGVGLGDTAGAAYEWGFSLLPATFLSSEHFLGWAPGFVGGSGTARHDDVGVFVVSAQDNSTVFVDFDGDGTADQTFTLDRLQSRYVFDPNDGDMTGAHFWSTGEFTLAYGENADTASTSTPSLDLGYVGIPGSDFISLVLDVQKTASKPVVASQNGAFTDFTIVASTREYSLNAMSITDTLPAGWQYVSGSTTITRPDLTTVTGTDADPTISGGGVVLTWSATDQLDPSAMAPNQTFTVKFRASTPIALAVGTLSQNRVVATGTRTVGGVTQTFSATDFAFVAIGSLSITKSSNPTNPIYPGDTIPYTVVVSSPSGSPIQTAVSIVDALPAGVAYVSGSGQITCERANNVRDEFDAVAYTNNGPNNTANWVAGWTETDTYPFGVAGAIGGYVHVMTGALRFRAIAAVRDNFSAGFATDSTNIGGTADWIGASWTETDPGGNGAGNGFVRVENNPSGSPALNFDGTNGGGGVDGRVTRSVNLTGATMATVTFDFAFSSLETGDQVQLQVSTNGTDFTPIATYDGGVAAGRKSHDISAHISPSTSIRFRITSGFANNNDEAYFDNVDVVYSASVATAAIPAGGAQILRTANLTGATSAWLRFNPTAANLESTDTLVVEAATSAGGTYTTLATYQGGTPTSAGPWNLSPYISATTTIRLRVTGGYNAGDEYLSIDDVDITWGNGTSTSFASDPPPNFLTGIPGCLLRGGGEVRLTFNVTVDDPFPTGSTLLTNVAATTSAQLPVQITASVTDQVTVPTVASATVAGRVWLDGDRDGAQDIGEPGISNVQVTLKDRFGTPVATLTTDVNGRYLFTGVAAGTGYYVEVTGGLPTGVAQTYPSQATYPNRTAPFNLAEGQAYSGADLGYGTQAGTVAFGDVAWVDADSDGVRDAGEVGLGGVTVTLYRDANGDGLLQPGTDTLVGTATTDSDGSYLFAGQTAGGTYFLTASTPSGYFPTNGTVYRFQGTTAGTSYLTADFGFAGTTYSISDRVWRDEDQDGTFDAGESGISGVTVEILDASLNVIGVTTTDANGVFTFSGLAGSGADYTTRISDTTGVLTNFTGTTSFALARQRAESNLDASRDRTATPSYGFFATRSLGDTLFFDVNGDGDQDAGENGIAGIVVALYSDTNGDGTIDAGEPLVGSMATDAAGRYLFSGLSNGSYVVSVPPLTGYTYTGTGAAADSDLATAGTQRAAAVSSGGNDFDVDFGFQANTPRSVSGTIWNDGDRDGVVDTGEARLAGVTVEVLSGTTVVATTTTDASGNYSFTGLASGTYDVRVTDTAGVLTGYFPTYERTEGTAGPFNYRETVNLTSGNQTGVNFGYGQPTPTYASVTSLTASVGGGTVVVEWRTSQEVGTVGFDLYRLEPATGAWTRVNDDLLPALAGSPRGGTYELEDRTAKSVPPLTYKLVETDAWGARREYGPWTLTALGTTGAPKERYRRTPEQPSADEQSRVSTARKEKDAATSAAARRSGERLKLRTKGRGIRYVDTAALATILGQKPSTLTGLVSTGLVSVENRGRQVAYLPAPGGAGLYFFAEAMEDPYTDENVYWMSGRKGVMMASQAGIATARTPAASFPETVHVEVDRYPLPAYFQDPEADFYAWEALYSGYAGWDTKSLTASLPGAAGTGKATLTVRLQGGSSSTAREDHHVTIAWNGAPVGETAWDGLTPREVVVTLSGADVVDGENTLTVKAVRDAGVPNGVVYVDSFDVAYERRYRAVNDELSFTVPAGGEAAVGGFTTSKVTVFDVTTPSTPSVVTLSGVTAEKDGTFAVRFANREPARRSYVALSLARAGAPVGVAGVAASRLRETTNAADYILVAPASLVAAAKELAAYRESTGVATMVVGLEEVHDEFTYGIASPVAVQELLEYAAASWRKAPEYLTLVGRGTFDYKDAQGVGDNLVPPLLVGTPFGLAASDVSFGSLTDGSGPGLRGIGRLPVLTGQELSDYVAKISAHESAREGAWQKNVLLVADNPDAGGAFTADSEALAALLAPPYGATRVYLPAFSPAAAKAAIVSTLGSGASVFNYVGHGGPDRLAAENIFTKAEVPALTNAGRLPLFLAWTCSAGNYAIPGFTSLSEALVLSKTGGAFAAFAPSGLSLNDGARALNQTFYRSVFVEGEKGVGRSAAKALGELPEEGATAYMKGIYNVIGEPLSRLP